ncbi:MAG: ABC transporter substrate-binding protein [Candidatus Methylomirabilales bacterium]
MKTTISWTVARRPASVIAVTLVAMILPLVTAGPAATGAASPATLTKVSTGIVGAIDQLGTPVALDRGFFEKWGLDVTIARPYPTGVDQLNALQAGEIQIGQVGVPMIGAVIRGMDLVILGNYTGSAARLGSDATTALVAREGSGIKPGDLQSLKGKRIAASFGTINHLYILGLLEKAGLKPSDVTLVNTPPQEMPVALLAKGIDAFSGWDPFPIMALKDVTGSYEVIRGGQVIGFLGFIVAMRDWAEKNADTVERFLAARAEADKWMRANPAGTAQIAVRWLPGTRLEIAQDAMKYNIQQLDIRISANNYRALYSANDRLNKLGHIPSVIDVNKVFAPQYILKVMKEHPDLFSDLGGIPQAAQVGPGYVFRP